MKFKVSAVVLACCLSLSPAIALADELIYQYRSGGSSWNYWEDDNGNRYTLFCDFNGCTRTEGWNGPRAPQWP